MRQLPDQGPVEVTVRMPDVEPFAGLLVALGRFTAALDDEAVKAMSVEAETALSEVETILSRLGRARVEQDDQEQGEG